MIIVISNCRHELIVAWRGLHGRVCFLYLFIYHISFNPFTSIYLSFNTGMIPIRIDTLLTNGYPLSSGGSRGGGHRGQLPPLDLGSKILVS